MFKLVWNRKRTNALVVAEAFFSFLVLFAVATLAVYNIANYRQPLGFRYDNVMLVSVTSLFQMSFGSERKEDDVQRMIDALRDMPQVEAAARLGFPMFEIGASSNHVEYKGRRLYSYHNDASDSFRDVLKIDLLEGRWFDASDDSAGQVTVVINRRLRDELFGTDNAVGRTFTDDHRTEYRVVGVISDFREDGELSAPGNYYIRRVASRPGQPLRVMSIVVRLHPGTPAAFQEQLLARLRSISRHRTFQIEPLAEKRAGYQKFQLAPLIAGGLVAAFMMLMVALGMVGVVWQSVARRAREIGLRRAMGATARDIWAQILGELLVTTSIGLLLGAAMVAQVPMLQLVSWISNETFFVSLGVSAALIYLLTVSAGLYPSWLATRVQPADVLHYE
jgi:putative ABC transport system permease protein